MNNELNIGKMHKSTKNKSSVWLRYALSKSNTGFSTFCFFEGEDKKYYLSRIAQISNKPFDEIVSFDCEGKDNVIKIKNKIASDNSEIENHLFFIDHDYDIKFSEQDIENVFVTSGYSIENYYSTPAAFSKLLNIEFSMDRSYKEFSEIIGEYKKEYKIFKKSSRKIGSWILALNRNGINVNYGNFKFMDLFNTSKEEFDRKKDINFDDILNYYCTKRKKLNVQDMKRIKNERKNILFEFTSILNSDISSSILSRGKFEIEFLKYYLNKLNRMNNETKLIHNDKLDHVTIDISSKNYLSAWSSYADTDDCLKDYIKNDFIKHIC